jgi:hypothetical protein
VCLEDDWKMAFKFTSDSWEQMNNLIYDIKNVELYECDNPILKLQLEKIETF